MKKLTVALVICCALLLVACCVLGIFLYKQNDEVSSLNYRIDRITKRYDSAYADLEHRYNNTNERLMNALNFYDDYVVIVSKGNCYHQYGCYDAITASGKFDVYTIVEAEKAGYTPCDCINSK